MFDYRRASSWRPTSWAALIIILIVCCPSIQSADQTTKGSSVAGSTSSMTFKPSSKSVSSPMLQVEIATKLDQNEEHSSTIRSNAGISGSGPFSTVQETIKGSISDAGDRSKELTEPIGSTTSAVAEDLESQAHSANNDLKSMHTSQSAEESNQIDTSTTANAQNAVETLNDGTTGSVVSDSGDLPKPYIDPSAVQKIALNETENSGKIVGSAVGESMSENEAKNITTNRTDYNPLSEVALSEIESSQVSVSSNSSDLSPKDEVVIDNATLSTLNSEPSSRPRKEDIIQYVYRTSGESHRVTTVVIVFYLFGAGVHFHLELIRYMLKYRDTTASVLRS